MKMIELMDALESLFRKFLFKFKSVSIDDISDEYILINPCDIVDFMNKCDGMLEIVNDSLPLIKRHFPDCPIYLAYDDDYDGNEDIYAIIISKDRSFEENFELHDALLNDFYEIEDNYPNAYLNFFMFFKNFDDYYEEWRLEELNKNNAFS